MDRRLHEERVDGRSKRMHPLAWTDVPAGAFAVVDDQAMLVLDDRLVPWSAAGYGAPVARPVGGVALALTPPSTEAVLRHGYWPVIHPDAGDT